MRFNNLVIGTQAQPLCLSLSSLCLKEMMELLKYVSVRINCWLNAPTPHPSCLSVADVDGKVPSEALRHSTLNVYQSYITYQAL